MSFRVELLEAWDSIKAARADGKVTPAEFLKIIGEFADAVQALVKGIKNDADFETLVLDTEWVVQNYIVPINLTNRPLIEMFIDSQMVAYVRPMLVAMRSTFKDGANPFDPS